MDSCDVCGGNGIVGVLMQQDASASDGVSTVPVCCTCEVGQNAKKANPTWKVASSTQTGNYWSESGPNPEDVL